MLRVPPSRDRLSHRLWISSSLSSYIHRNPKSCSSLTSHSHSSHSKHFCSLYTIICSAAQLIIYKLFKQWMYKNNTAFVNGSVSVGLVNSIRCPRFPLKGCRPSVWHTLLISSDVPSQEPAPFQWERVLCVFCAAFPGLNPGTAHSLVKSWENRENKTLWADAT